MFQSKRAHGLCFWFRPCLPVAYAQTVKIAYIDRSGGMANVGEAGLKQFQFVIEDINKRNLAGGPKLKSSLRQQAQPAGKPERAEEGDRSGIRNHHPGQRFPSPGALIDSGGQA